MGKDTSTSMDGVTVHAAPHSPAVFVSSGVRPKLGIKLSRRQKRRDLRQLHSQFDYGPHHSSFGVCKAHNNDSVRIVWQPASQFLRKLKKVNVTDFFSNGSIVPTEYHGRYQRRRSICRIRISSQGRTRGLRPFGEPPASPCYHKQP